MPNRRDEEARHGTRTHVQGHSHIPRMRNEPSHAYHQPPKAYQHENGLDPTTTSHNGRNAKSTTDNVPPPKQKGGGFETFVMTGDMIIRTTKKSEPARKSPSEKLPKKVTGTLKEPSSKSSADTSKQKTQGSPVKTQGSPVKAQGSPVKTHGSPSKAQNSPSKTQSSPSKLASPSKIPTSPSKSKKPESKIPMPSKSRIPKPASQKESPKHSAKESPKTSRTPLSIPRSEQLTVGASLASPESTDIENLELVNNNVILNDAKRSETVDKVADVAVIPQEQDIPKEPEFAMEERGDLVVVEHWPPPQDPHHEPVTPDYDFLTQQPHPLRMESPMSPGEPVFSLELDQPEPGNAQPVVEQLIDAMSEPPLEACAAGGMYPGELPHSAPVHPQGYMSFAGYRFPDVDLALDIPPDDISSEDDNYKNATDSLVDVDDLPPPPDELLQDIILKPEPHHGNPPLSPYPASAILLREEFSAIGAAQASRSQNDHPFLNGGHRSTFEPTTLETVVETEVPTSGSRDFSPAISVPGANSHHNIGMSMSAEKIQHGRQGPGVKCAAPMVGVRTSRSQENYFQSTADGMSLVDIDFDESMASSVDALPYGYRDKTSTSMDTVSMPGHVPLHDDHSQEMSRSLDNSPERSYDKYVERIQMPTFISLDEPRAKKSKEGRGRSLDADADDDDLVDPYKGVFSQDQYVAPPSVEECVLNGHQPREARGSREGELTAFTDRRHPGEEEGGEEQELLPPELPDKARTDPGDDSGARCAQTDPSSPGEDRLILSGVTQTSSDTEAMGPSVMCSKPSRSSRTPSASPSHSGGERAGGGGANIGSQPLAEANTAAAHSAAAAAAASAATAAASPKAHQQQQSPCRKEKQEAESRDHFPSSTEQQGFEAGVEGEEEEDEEEEEEEVQGVAEESVRESSDGEREGQSELLAEPTIDIEQAEMVAASSSAGPASLDGGESDSDSIYHQPIKDVDRPSAARLAKRLFHNDGFKRQDISRHLHKKNDFAQLVGEEYLKFFDFAGNTLEQSLRKFLKHLTLAGETQERERVLAHFSKRFMECNPVAFKSEDACHTLTCALMLLNTDLHGQNIGRKMTLNEFIENLADLNDGENFPKDTLKQLYTAIKTEPLECEIEDDVEDLEALVSGRSTAAPPQEPRFIGHNPFLDVPDPGKAVEYKKGYVMRKCCIDTDGRRTPMGRRGWKMFYVVLRDMIMYLHKDEPAMKKAPVYENTSNAIRIHHSLATKAADYTKKQHVFRLHLADGAQYLFQTSDSKECQEWIDTINFVAASLSAAPLPGAVGSQKKFQRPLMPSSYTKMNLREQLLVHEQQIQQREQELHDHQLYPPEKGAKSRVIADYMEKEHYLQFELKRFKTYLFLLQAKLASFPELEPSLVEVAIGEVDEPLPSPESSHTPRKQQQDQQNSTSPPAAKDRPREERSKPVQRSMSDRLELDGLG